MLAKRRSHMLEKLKKLAGTILAHAEAARSTKTAVEGMSNEDITRV